jgi:hypothetical protein
MCFNIQITATMMLLNLGTGLLLAKQGNPWRRNQVGARLATRSSDARSGHAAPANYSLAPAHLPRLL